MKNYNKAGQKLSGARKTYLQMLEDEEERRRRERQQGTGLTNLADTYKPAGSKGVSSMPGLTNLNDLSKPAAAASSGSSQAKAPQNKTANMFYTNAPKSGTIMPRFISIAAYKRAIEEGNKKLDELAHKQFQAMLKNDVSGMNALEKQYKDTKRYVGSLKAELGEVMGAGIHGKRGNQLTGSGWFGRKMDELSAEGTAAKQTKLGDETDKKIIISSGGGYADFFREQRGEGRSETGQSWGGSGYADFFQEQRGEGRSETSQSWGGSGYADFFREQREGEKGGAGGSWGDGENAAKAIEKDQKDAAAYEAEKQQRSEALSYKPTAEFVSFITEGLQSAVSNLNQALRTGNPAMIALCKEEADMYQAVSDMILNPSDDNWTLYNQMGNGLKALEQMRDSGGNDEELALIQDQIIAINRGMNVVGEAYLDEVDQKWNKEEINDEQRKQYYRDYYASVIEREKGIEIESKSLKEGNLILASESQNNMLLFDILEAYDVPMYSTEKDAVFAFKKEAMPLTLQNEREYSAILDSIDLLNTETGEVQTYYYYLDIKQGDKDKVIWHAILGARGGKDRKLLHTHPVDGGWNRNFSGDPENQGILNRNPAREKITGEMGDSNVPTTLGYGGIYVVGSGAEVKLYEGKGETVVGSGRNTYANTKKELQYLSTIDLY